MTFTEIINGAIPLFNWTQAQAAQATTTRGGPANWIRGIVYNSWGNADVNNVNLPLAFFNWFGPVRTTNGAVSAIADLKQRSTKNVSSFMDRCKVAVSMLHYNLPEAERNAAFRQSYTRLVVAQFGSGLGENLRTRVLWVPNPPATIIDVFNPDTADKAEKRGEFLLKF